MKRQCLGGINVVHLEFRDHPDDVRKAIEILGRYHPPVSQLKNNSMLGKSMLLSLLFGHGSASKNKSKTPCATSFKWSRAHNNDSEAIDAEELIFPVLRQWDASIKPISVLQVVASKLLKGMPEDDYHEGWESI